MPWLQWQTSDLQEDHPGIVAWLSGAGLDNLCFPIKLDVASNKWPTDRFDGVFSANTAHIMAWSEVQVMFHGIGKLLPGDGVFCLYGPFNYQGQFTSSSNAYFDQHLKQKTSRMGIRDFESVVAEANSQGLVLLADHEMPANNRTLIWQKQ